MTHKKMKTMDGNTAAAYVAYAFTEVAAIYPITPSSEIAQHMSNEFPRLGRTFIQMEDEIASLGACIGASLAGKKVLTATSGPGMSLKTEILGLASIAELPLVVVNVQRGGPSTGASQVQRLRRVGSPSSAPGCGRPAARASAGSP